MRVHHTWMGTAKAGEVGFVCGAGCSAQMSRRRPMWMGAGSDALAGWGGVDYGVVMRQMPRPWVAA